MLTRLLGPKAHNPIARLATDRCYPLKEYVLQLPGVQIESDSDSSLPNTHSGKQSFQGASLETLLESVRDWSDIDFQ